LTILYPGRVCECGTQITRFTYDWKDTFTAVCPTCGQENILKIVKKENTDAQ